MKGTLKKANVPWWLPPQFARCAPVETVPVCLSLPHLKEDGKAEKVEDGKEEVAADVVDSIILADELSSAQEGNKS